MLNKNGKRFYNHELTEIENLGPTRVPADRRQELAKTDRDSSVLDIVRKHLRVKPAGAREVLDPPKQSEIP